MSNAAGFAARFAAATASTRPLRSASIVATGFASLLSGYFVLMACSLYWLTRAGASLFAVMLPRTLIERAPLAWTLASSLLVAALTQTVPGFFPDYGSWSEIGLEALVWLALGLFARIYLVTTSYPDTFSELRASIASRPLERLLADHLHHPIDAVFTRVWLANSIAIIPLSVLLVIPSTVNYLVIVGYTVMLLLTQLPQEITDHTNIHTRIFQPKLGASPRAKRVLGWLQVYFEWVLTLLVARVPGYYRVQHVHIHHTEDNGPADSQTTLPYDRTSFLDFSRHAFRQGVDLVTGWWVLSYLRAKGKAHLVREVLHGLVLWYAILLVLAVLNPIAALVLFSSRFLGGNILSLIAFYWHGVVDPEDHQGAHGNSIEYVGSGHGNLGDDFHAVHHLRPGRHWSHYYEEFTKQERRGHPGIVMQKEAFGPLVLVAALWRRDFSAIARHARLGETTGDELARIIEERTRPQSGGERTGLAGRVDRALGRIMAIALPKTFGGSGGLSSSSSRVPFPYGHEQEEGNIVGTAARR